VLVVIGLACAVVFLRRIESLALAAWIFVSAGFLILQQPLLDHHFVLLATALAVPAGAGLGAAVVSAGRARLVVAGALAVALALAVVQEQDRLADQEGEPPGVTWAVERLRTTTRADDLVGADLPIVPYLADRRVPGQLVDTSFVRLGIGSLTDREILDEIDSADVAAVVLGREFRSRPLLFRDLVARYPLQDSVDDVTVLVAPSP
jgi:hypothetical protein